MSEIVGYFLIPAALFLVAIVIIGATNLVQLGRRTTSQEQASLVLSRKEATTFFIRNLVVAKLSFLVLLIVLAEAYFSLP